MHEKTDCFGYREGYQEEKTLPCQQSVVPLSFVITSLLYSEGYRILTVNMTIVGL